MKPTIEQLNKWQDIVRSYNNKPIPMEELANKCAEEGLAEVNSYLISNNIIARMKDGNTFVHWSSNRYNPDDTFINLKAELNGQPRKLTLEERVEILENTIKEIINNR